MQHLDEVKKIISQHNYHSLSSGSMMHLEESINQLVQEAMEKKPVFENFVSGGELQYFQHLLSVTEVYPRRKSFDN